MLINVLLRKNKQFHHNWSLSEWGNIDCAQQEKGEQTCKIAWNGSCWVQLWCSPCRGRRWWWLWRTLLRGWRWSRWGSQQGRTYYLKKAERRESEAYRIRCRRVTMASFSFEFNSNSLQIQEIFVYVHSYIQNIARKRKPPSLDINKQNLRTKLKQGWIEIRWSNRMWCVACCYTQKESGISKMELFRLPS